MDAVMIWITKMVLAHLVTDFILQPRSWIDSRKKKHFRDPILYVHGLLTAWVALLAVGYHFWLTASIIFITHVLIDGWKSYRTDDTKFFVIDQLLHLLVIFGCWYFLFLHPQDIVAAWKELNNKNILILITAFVLVTQPASIFISQVTRKWRDQVMDPVSLGNAGKWIGILERIIMLALVLHHQYQTMGLLIAAKSLLRFSETNRPEIKTEYLLIGTLISISIAILTGIIALQMIGWDT